MTGSEGSVIPYPRCTGRATNGKTSGGRTRGRRANSTDAPMFGRPRSGCTTARFQCRPSPRVEVSEYLNPDTNASSIAPHTSRTVPSSGAAKSRSVENRPAPPRRHFRKLVPPLNVSDPSANNPSSAKSHSRWSCATSSNAASYVSARPAPCRLTRARVSDGAAMSGLSFCGLQWRD